MLCPRRLRQRMSGRSPPRRSGPTVKNLNYGHPRPQQGPLLLARRPRYARTFPAPRLSNVRRPFAPRWLMPYACVSTQQCNLWLVAVCHPIRFRYDESAACRQAVDPYRAVARALSLLSACTSTADIFPLNASARAIGDPDIKFVRKGIDQGPVTATLDGEVLHGHYHVARDGGIVMAFSGGQTAPRSAKAAAGCSSCCEVRAPRCCAEARSVSAATETASARPKTARSGQSATRAVSNPSSPSRRCKRRNTSPPARLGSSPG
jgi:hypothetical protein